jgi:hypothetical protein
MVVFQLISKKQNEVLSGVQLFILYVKINPECQQDSGLKNFISFVFEMSKRNCAIFCST